MPAAAVPTEAALGLNQALFELQLALFCLHPICDIAVRGDEVRDFAALVAQRRYRLFGIEMFARFRPVYNVAAIDLARANSLP